MTNTQSAKENFLNSKIMKPTSCAGKPNLDVSLMSSLNNTMKISGKIKDTNRLDTRALTTPDMRNTTTNKTQKVMMKPKKEQAIQDTMSVLIRLVTKAGAILLTIPIHRIVKEPSLTVKVLILIHLHTMGKMILLNAIKANLNHFTQPQRVRLLIVNTRFMQKKYKQSETSRIHHLPWILRIQDMKHCIRMDKRITMHPSIQLSELVAMLIMGPLMSVLNQETIML